MAQGANGAGLSLPIRVHDLMLNLAGRLDDDALADARELLAAAEVDRSLEFLVGCLAAGRVAISGAQRAELAALFTQVYRHPAVIDRLVVDDGAVRHQFGGGAVNGEGAGAGIAEAARRVLDVLPDVRSVWAAWRLTPAGAVSGPVPHRVVLVGVGPNGFPPATSYRLEHALRRGGIRASVEVLRDGAEAPEYHHQAMQFASQVPFSPQAGVPAPVPARPRATVVAEPRPPVAPSPPRPVVAPAAPAVPEISAPTRRSRSEAPADPLASINPPSPPSLPAVPAVPPSSWLSELPESTMPKPAKAANGASAPSSYFGGDDSLNEQEKQLLRQLQEELARREQEESDQTLGRHLGNGNGHLPGPATFEWPNDGGSPTVINGIPPQHPDQRR